MQLTASITNTFDKQSWCDGVFLDFSKAFDRVNHDAILSALSSWGSPSAQSWVMAFVTSRSMSVRVGSSFSPSFRLAVGVPQGSHLGPLFFFKSQH